MRYRGGKNELKNEYVKRFSMTVIAFLLHSIYSVSLFHTFFIKSHSPLPSDVVLPGHLANFSQD